MKLDAYEKELLEFDESGKISLDLMRPKNLLL